MSPRHATLLVLVACADPATPEPESPPHLVVTTQGLDFGTIDCGGNATRSFVVENTGEVELEAVIVSTLGGVTVTPDRVTVPGHETATIEVAVASPANAIPGRAFLGDLLIGGTGGSTRVPLAFTPAGAIVKLDKPTLDFGETIPNGFAGVSRDFAITVEGTAGADLVFGALPPKFRLVGSPSAHLDPGQTGNFRVVMDPDTTEETLTGTMPITVDAPLCAPAPKELAVTGRATNDLLTVSTTVVDFGEPPCNKYTFADIELVNRSPQLTFYKLKRIDPIGFISGEFSSLSTEGSLEENQTKAAKILHAPFPYEIDPPLGSYSADVEVTINDAVKKTVRVLTTIAHPRLSGPQGDVDLGTVPTDEPVTHTFVIKNTGNRIDDIEIRHEYLPVGPEAQTEVSPQQLQLAPNATATIQVTMTPSIAGEPFGRFIDVIGRCGQLSTRLQGVAR